MPGVEDSQLSAPSGTRGPEGATDCHSAEGGPTPTPALDSERPRDGVGTKVWCLAAPAAFSSLPSEQRAD